MKIRVSFSGDRGVSSREVNTLGLCRRGCEIIHEIQNFVMGGRIKERRIRENNGRMIGGKKRKICEANAIDRAEKK